MTRFALIAIATAITACSSTPPTMDLAVGDLVAIDARDLSFAPRDPAKHPPSFKVPTTGGPVLNAIEVYTVVWQGDEELGARVERFHDWLVHSSYWTQSTSEYGVGAGTSKGLIVLPGAAPPDRDALVAQLSALVATGDVVATDNAYVSFVLPKGTTFDDGCKQVGYHLNARITDGDMIQDVAWSANKQCPGFGTGASWESLTEVLSHEAVEAATDPRPASGYYLFDFATTIGGELSDLCANLALSYVLPPPLDDVYFVTRNWSNQAAQAHDEDPCVPAPSHPYFNVAARGWFLPAESPARLEVTRSVSPVIDVVFEPFAYGDVGIIKWRMRVLGPPGFAGKLPSGEGRAGETIVAPLEVAQSALVESYTFVIESAASTGGKNQFLGTLVVR